MTKKYMREGTGVADATGAATASENQKATHTPGPWVVSDRDGATYIACCDSRSYVALVIDDAGDNWPVDANAHLLAMAPDLLRELKESLQFFVSEDTDPSTYCEWYLRAREVIAKAEGQ